MAGSVEMKITAKKGIGFYFNAAASLLRGRPITELTMTALGNAVNVAISVADKLEKEGLAKLSKISTSYPTLDSGISCCSISIGLQKVSLDVSALAPALAKEIEECGVWPHIIYVQPEGKSDSDAAAELDKMIGGSRMSRIGVIGSTTYDFPGSRYKEHGKEAVEKIVQDAADAVLAKAQPSRVVMGGSYFGPQGSFAEACGQHASSRLCCVHVMPNIDEGLGMLQGVLWGEGQLQGIDWHPSGSGPKKARTRQGDWVLAFVGSSWSRRNCMLASLNGNYAMCAGGPGTHTELCELRYRGAGLLPLVRTGGLCEGMKFGDKSAEGMIDALRSVAPNGVTEGQWHTVLGDGEASLDEYCSAVQGVFGNLRFAGVEPLNRWPMNADEREKWETFKQSDPDFDHAKS